MFMGLRGGSILAGSTSPVMKRGRQALAVRWMTVALLTVLVAAGFGAVAPERAFAGQAGTINTNNAEIFEHPTDLTVIDYANAGEVVDIFWGPEFFMYEIRTGDGTVGWVWAEFLDADGGAGGGAADVAASSTSTGSAEGANVWAWSAWAMVDADSLNVRGDASSNAGVIDSYGAGEWIEVIGNDVNGYSPVNYYGEIGWVASQYLSWDGAFNNATVASVAPETAQSTASLGGGSAGTSLEHWIDINGATGQVNLMVGDSVYATYWGSVGYDTSSDGFFSTASGSFSVYAMYEPLGYTAWAEAYISHWIGFDPSRSNGFHSYSKDANGNILPNGAGKTGGCVALAPAAIQAVFDFAYMGMRVEVHR